MSVRAAYNEVFTVFDYSSQDVVEYVADVVLALPVILIKGKIYRYDPGNHSYRCVVFPIFARIVFGVAVVTVVVVVGLPYIGLLAVAAIIKLNNAQNHQLYSAFLRQEEARRNFGLNQQRMLREIDAALRQLDGPRNNPTPQSPAAAPQVAFSVPSGEEKECAICLDVVDKTQMGHLEEVRILECAHIFHTRCIKPWAELNSTCPSCRNESRILTQMAPNRLQNGVHALSPRAYRFLGRLFANYPLLSIDEWRRVNEDEIMIRYRIGVRFRIVRAAF